MFKSESSKCVYLEGFAKYALEPKSKCNKKKLKLELETLQVSIT